MRSIELRRERELKKMDRANWSPRRELSRAIKLAGVILFCLAASLVALFLMLLPISAARDPWQLFVPGGMGETAWTIGSVLFAAIMFGIGIKEFDPKLPRLRRPK